MLIIAIKLLPLTVSFFSPGGVVTKEDLSGYKALWKRPVLLHLANGDYTLYGPPPPSSSVIVNYILGIMDGKLYFSNPLIFPAIRCTKMCIC